jgi:glyoxylase-like metal-dependent hydrolase (beta-lactamase superfamily II)
MNMTPMDPAEVPKIVTLAEGVQVRQEIDNIAWVDLGGCAVVIDALERPELEREVLAALRAALGGTPVGYVLNTHTHYDHVALNGALRREFGAQIVNQETDPVGPEGRWFQGTVRRLHWVSMPGCHTPEDCIAWLPEDRILFVGDIFGWGLIPLIGRLTDRTAQLLLDTYARLIDLGPAVVVPGHGPLGDRQTLVRWVQYFQWLRRQCSAAVAAGKSDDQIRQETPAPTDMHSWWRLLIWKHADSLTKVLQSIRRGDLKGPQ